MTEYAAICIAAYSIMYDPTFLLLPLVSVTGYFYLPLVYFPGWIAVEVRGVGVLVPTRWVMLSLEDVKLTGSSGCRNGLRHEIWLML